MTVRTYSPKKVSVIYGPNIISGFSENSIIKFEPSSDSFSKVVGADGEVTRTHHADLTGKFTITLKQSSESNAILSALHALDKTTLGGALPLFVKDMNGTTTFAAEKAWIMRYPDVEFTNEASDREWTFETDKVTILVGGNFIS